jgi:hypothetical protein
MYSLKKALFSQTNVKIVIFGEIGVLSTYYNSCNFLQKSLIVFYKFLSHNVSKTSLQPFYIGLLRQVPSRPLRLLRPRDEDQGVRAAA